jgi:hypothetical protein
MVTMFLLVTTFTPKQSYALYKNSQKERVALIFLSTPLCERLRPHAGTRYSCTKVDVDVNCGWIDGRLQQLLRRDRDAGLSGHEVRKRSSGNPGSCPELAGP